jgi:hypothetical protein
MIKLIEFPETVEGTWVDSDMYQVMTILNEIANHLNRVETAQGWTDYSPKGGVGQGWENNASV